MILDDALVAYLRRAGRELDAALSRELQLAGITPAPAGRRQTEKEITMPDDYSEAPSRGDFVRASAGRAMPSDMSEAEAHGREELQRAMQWLGLLDVHPDMLLDRTAGAPLAQTLDEISEIERSAEQLERIARGLRNLRETMRESISQHVSRHDQRREEQLAKVGAR